MKLNENEPETPENKTMHESSVIHTFDHSKKKLSAKLVSQCSCRVPLFVRYYKAAVSSI